MENGKEPSPGNLVVIVLSDKKKYIYYLDYMCLFSVFRRYFHSFDTQFLIYNAIFMNTLKRKKTRSNISWDNNTRRSHAFYATFFKVFYMQNCNTRRRVRVDYDL